MRLQGNHQFSLIGILLNSVHQLCRDAAASHGRAHRKIDNVHAAVGVQVICPDRVEVILAADKIPKGTQRMVVTDQIHAAFQRVIEFDSIILERIIRLCLIGDNDDTV